MLFGKSSPISGFFSQVVTSSGEDSWGRNDSAATAAAIWMSRIHMEDGTGRSDAESAKLRQASRGLNAKAATYGPVPPSLLSARLLGQLDANINSSSSAMRLLCDQ